MTLTVQRVRLGHVADSDGALIFKGDVLVGVASQLSSEHGDRAGRWFLECSFGFEVDTRADFDSLDLLCAWVQDRLGDGGGSSGPSNGSSGAHSKPR